MEKTDKLAQMRQKQQSNGDINRLWANVNEHTASRRGAEGKSGVWFLLLPVFAGVSERLFMLRSKGSNADGGAICGEPNRSIQT